MSVLNRKVLVLNRLWQVIDEKTVEQAFTDLAGGNYTAMRIEGDMIAPVTWEEWIQLPPLNEEEVVHTRTKGIRMPTVILACNFDRVPKRRPKLTLLNVAKRDGYRCQYTGKILTRDRMSLDHVVPRSRGGRDSLDNVVLADKEVNNRKGDKTPQEAGLPVPVIRKMDYSLATPSHPHHQLFLKQ